MWTPTNALRRYYHYIHIEAHKYVYNQARVRSIPLRIIYLLFPKTALMVCIVKVNPLRARARQPKWFVLLSISFRINILYQHNQRPLETAYKNIPSASVKNRGKEDNFDPCRVKVYNPTKNCKFFFLIIRVILFLVFSVCMWGGSQC